MGNKNFQENDFFSSKAMDKLKLRGCGMINCGSRLQQRNSVSEDIKRIISNKNVINRRSHE